MRFRGLTAIFGTLLPRGLPNCNTAPPADTPRTPACPLAAAVAVLLGQRGKMTDFRALAEKMRPLLNEAKLKSRPESMTSRFDPHAIVTTHMNLLPISIAMPRPSTQNAA